MPASSTLLCSYYSSYSFGRTNQTETLPKGPQGCDGTAKGIKSLSACVFLFGSYPLTSISEGAGTYRSTFVWGENMRLNRIAAKFALVALIVLCAATMVSAGTIRGVFWRWRGQQRTALAIAGAKPDLPFAGNGKKATMRREIVCLNQDVENALAQPRHLP